MTEYQTIAVEPLTAAIGAIVHGVDATRPLPAGQREELHVALRERLVIFLRAQNVTEEQQLAFTREFGALNAGSIDPRPNPTPNYFVSLEDNATSPPKADRWHTDLPFVAEPPNVAVLSMQVVPPTGGDTLWSSLYAVYDALSPQMRDRLDALELDLGLGASAATIKELYGEQYYNDVVVPFTSVRHPLVRVHPETGRHALYLCGSFMNHIVGLHPAESDMLLRFLNARLDDPNIQVRWKWRQHDLAVWDERCTNHRAMSDHFPARRLVRRSLAGRERPIGVREALTAEVSAPTT